MLEEEDLDIALKVIIVGNGSVGKSSMIQRYCKGIFTKDYKKTIGVDFLERQLDLNGEDVRLMIWDTAGQEEFDALTKHYYRGAQACIYVFSITDRASFEAIPSWKDKVEAECGLIASALVQNKMDLQALSLVSETEAMSLAEELEVRLFSASVKENRNINEVFEYLSLSCLSASTGDYVDDDSDMIKAIPGVFSSSNNSSQFHSNNILDSSRDQCAGEGGDVELDKPPPPAPPLKQRSSAATTVQTQSQIYNPLSHRIDESSFRIKLSGNNEKHKKRRFSLFTKPSCNIL